MNNKKEKSGFSVFNFILWSLVVIIFVLFISSVNYTFHDPDSQLYSKLAQELSQQPLKTWIAPRWVAYSGLESYFREHPSGALWVTAAMIRLGAPPGQAAAIANFLYFLLTLLFVFKLSFYFKDEITGWAMTWSVFLIPVSFQYIIRGNLEPPLTMATVMGMYCLCRAHEKWRYRIGFALALILAVFFKGMQGCFVGIVGGFYWLMVQRDKTRLFTLIGSAFALLAVMAFYEWLYWSQTGEQFWLVNFRIQGGAAMEHNALWQKPYNFIWYLARSVYFALPWSIFLLLGLRNAKTRSLFPKDRRWRWLIVSASTLILIMSCFDRRADRYIFPGYILIAMAGGWYLSEKYSKVRLWLNSSPHKLNILFATAILTVAVISTFISIYFYSNIQIWRD